MSYFIDSDKDTGVRRSELVNWYLKEIESDLDSEAELIRRKTLCEKIIYRLVTYVSNHCRDFPCIRK